MKIPPIEWADLHSLGLQAGSSINFDGSNVICYPEPNKILYQLINRLIINQAPEPENKMDYLRHIRDILVSLTDWTQTNDSPLSEVQKTAWKNYRQQLRDLPSVYSGDGPIPWPALPV